MTTQKYPRACPSACQSTHRDQLGPGHWQIILNTPYFVNSVILLRAAKSHRLTVFAVHGSFDVI